MTLGQAAISMLKSARRLRWITSHLPKMTVGDAAAMTMVVMREADKLEADVREIKLTLGGVRKGERQSV